MNKMSIGIKYKKGFAVKEGNGESKTMTTSLLASCMNLGYIFSQELFDVLCTLNNVSVEALGKSLIKRLKELKGADVEYNPMYPNFPEQVMEMSDTELYLNAVFHYWTSGEWKPEYVKEVREYAVEHTYFTELGCITIDEFKSIFTDLLSSNDSLMESDKETIEYFLRHPINLTYPDTIPYKETLALVASHLLYKGESIDHLVTNSTDVLRIFTYMSGGDVSLATNTKFVSLPRATRKILVNALEGVIHIDDLLRHRNKWVKAAHSLHVGDYSTSVHSIMRTLRENKPVKTIIGKVEEFLEQKRSLEASTLLSNRPGEFARRLDHLVRISKDKDVTSILSNFNNVKNKVSTRVLLQTLGHFNTRNNENHRLVFPKGSTQKAKKLPALERIDDSIVYDVTHSIVEELENRFSNLDPLGNVYVDTDLSLCPLPTQMRSASEGLVNVGRGTYMDIGSNLYQKTLRMFVYWVGRDIDLSATFHDENFKMVSQVSYTNLRNGNNYHSGDIVNASRGAAEFIDISLDKAPKGAKYVVMNLYVYNGPTFGEHDKCHVGWMTRSKPNSNEIFEPSTVNQKVDLTGNSKNAIPVVFDLELRKAIWCDLYGTSSRHMGGNNLHSNKASVEEVLSGIVDTNRFSLYDLFIMHAQSRGTLVHSRDEADFTFGFEESDITPFKITEINSQFIA